MCIRDSNDMIEPSGMRQSEQLIPGAQDAARACPESAFWNRGLPPSIVFRRQCPWSSDGVVYLLGNRCLEANGALMALGANARQIGDFGGVVGPWYVWMRPRFLVISNLMESFVGLCLPVSSPVPGLSCLPSSSCCS
eukprot:3279566-Pyramimonas_sp.AAC.1